MVEHDKSIANVTDEDYDGRNLVPDENTDGVEHYIGVDPIYQNYANETEKPYPFSEEELENAAARGGIVIESVDEQQADSDPVDDGSTSKKSPVKKTSSSPPSASVPSQKSSPDSK